MSWARMLCKYLANAPEAGATAMYSLMREAEVSPRCKANDFLAMLPLSVEEAF